MSVRRSQWIGRRRRCGWGTRGVGCEVCRGIRGILICCSDIVQAGERSAFNNEIVEVPVNCPKAITGRDVADPLEVADASRDGETDQVDLTFRR